LLGAAVIELIDVLCTSRRVGARRVAVESMTVGN
jgi:hypothetical protein